MEYKEIEVEEATPTSKKSIVFASIGLGLLSFSGVLALSIILYIFSIFTIIHSFVFSTLGLIFGIKDKRLPAIIMSSISLGIMTLAIIIVIVCTFSIDLPDLSYEDLKLALSI